MRGLRPPLKTLHRGCATVAGPRRDACAGCAGVGEIRKRDTKYEKGTTLIMVITVNVVRTVVKSCFFFPGVIPRASHVSLCPPWGTPLRYKNLPLSLFRSRQSAKGTQHDAHQGEWAMERHFDQSASPCLSSTCGDTCCINLRPYVAITLSVHEAMPLDQDDPASGGGRR